MVVKKWLVEWWRVGAILGVFLMRNFLERGALPSAKLRKFKRLNHYTSPHGVLDTGEDVGAVRLMCLYTDLNKYMGAEICPHMRTTVD